MSTSKLSPLQAIKQFCSICNGETKGGKKYDCLDVECNFYPWKEGKGVFEDTDSVSEEHKARLAASKKAYWESRKKDVLNGVSD